MPDGYAEVAIEHSFVPDGCRSEAGVEQPKSDRPGVMIAFCPSITGPADRPSARGVSVAGAEAWRGNAEMNSC